MYIDNNGLINTRKLFIESFGKEQKERYIDKCPRCGKHNMCASDGITTGRLSKLVDVFICPECYLAELEEEQQKDNFPLPLSGWAWFDPKTGWSRFDSKCKDVSVPKEENHGKE